MKTRTRKVTFGGACSLDGFFARKDDSVDWLMWSDEAGEIMQNYWKTVDTVLMGRKTYEVALRQTKGKGGGSFHEVETLNVYAYGLSFDYNQYGLSSAVLILFFMIIIGSMWLLTMRKKAVSK